MFTKNRTEITSEQVVQELLAHPDSEWHEYRGRGAIRRRVCAFLAPRAEHPNTQARAREDVMFGCSDDYHWMRFGTYLQHGQSPPASTPRTAAVDTRTYHGSQRAALTAYCCC
jgi:hypothetical protein